MIRSISLALVLAAAIPARADTIAITEFLYNAQGADDFREFIEFFNYGTDPINMAGWTFEDANGPVFAYSFPRIVVPPSGFLILTRDKTFFQNEWLGGQADARVLGGQPVNLNNTAAEELVVKNPSGVVVWNLGYPTPDATVGRAVFLSEPNFAVTNRGTDTAPGISFSGNDPATGTLGFQRNNFTADPNQYTSTNSDVGSPLMLPCMGNFATGDDDGDGVCNDLDACPGFDDNVDSDNDGVADACDVCSGFDDSIDGDGDGVPDGCDQFTIDTTEGTINALASGNIHGVPYAFDGFVAGGTMVRFVVAGDLVVNDGEILDIFGTRGLSLVVANNVEIGVDAIIYASALDEAPGPGGGFPGAGDSEGGPGRAGTCVGGIGGTGGVPGLGGVGGLPCLDGLNGIGGLFGGLGLPGLDAIDDETTGGDGTDGINSPAGGGLGNTIIVAGGGGGPLGTGAGGGGGGAGGNGGTTASNGDDGNDGGAASTPSTAGAGADGVAGGSGNNTGSGTLISGGGGGGGGTAGGGGGGGGSGGGGGGAGGGGGGGGECAIWTGGGGGAGGAGGAGGCGGDGADGGAGGHGGAGGGAFEIIALGRYTASGIHEARGGDGEDTPVGPLGDLGSLGNGGFGGSNGDNVSNAGDGGDGGHGGAGGRGGRGGQGGTGGDGGGGGGGTVKIFATAIDAPGALIDVSGGAAGSGNEGFGGRILLGENVVGPAIIGTLLGAAPQTFAGPREANPYVASSPSTPFVADLVGGAEIYGLAPVLPGDVPGLVDDAPDGAIAALVRMDVGPAGFDDDYDGFDMILVVNLAEQALGDPACGVGTAGFSNPLQTRGIAGNPEFGGGGASVLSGLAPADVWATLIPDSAMQFNLQADGHSATIADLAPGDALYLVPGGQPCPWDLDGDGNVGVTELLALLGLWGTNPGGPPDFDGDGDVTVTDLLDLLGHWGACP